MKDFRLTKFDWRGKKPSWPLWNYITQWDFIKGNVNKSHVLFPSWSSKNHSTVYDISSYFCGDYGRLCRNEASISLGLFVNIENQACRQTMLEYHELMCQVSKIIRIFINTV